MVPMADNSAITASSPMASGSEDSRLRSLLYRTLTSEGPLLSGGDGPPPFRLLCLAGSLREGALDIPVAQRQVMTPKEGGYKRCQDLAHRASCVRTYLELTALSAGQSLQPLPIAVPVFCPCLDRVNAAVPPQGPAAAWPAACCPCSFRDVGGHSSYSNEPKDLKDARLCCILTSHLLSRH